MQDQRQRDIFFLGRPVLESKSFILNIPYAGEGEIKFVIHSEEYGDFPTKLETCYSSRLRKQEGAFVLGDNSIIRKTDSKNILSVAPLSFEQLKECLNKFVKSNKNYDDFKD